MATLRTLGPLAVLRAFATRHDRGLLYLAGLVPAAWTFGLAVTDHLGADPAKTLERTLGLWALRFVVAGLAVTPLLKLARINLVRYRRALGLLAFYYAALHLAAYVLFDLGFDWAAIWRDIVKRPYITIGFAAFLMLLPLAVTSTDGMIRRLGAEGWQRLHRLAYPAAAAAALHYLLLVKVVTAEPAAYAAVITLLLALRLVPRRGRRQPQRTRAATGRTPQSVA